MFLRLEQYSKKANLRSWAFAETVWVTGALFFIDDLS